jgi:hypothetical protein
MTIDLTQLRTLLHATIPDTRAVFPEEFVMAVGRALPEDVQKSLVGEVIGAAERTTLPEVDDDYILDYWKVSATHERPGVHKFTGVVPMVRIRVPETKMDISTMVGVVFAGDALRWTKQMAKDRTRAGLVALADKLAESRPDYAAACHKAAEAKIVDVQKITPARLFGARFAAIAVETHIGVDGKPVAYRIEVGMATGAPIVDFVSPVGFPIEKRPTWFEPTPFATETQVYEGDLEYGADVFPHVLDVWKYDQRADAHWTVHTHAVFEKVDQPDTTWPATLTAQAALRVAAIADKMGKQVPGLGPLTGVLAAFGRDLDWIQKP